MDVSVATTGNNMSFQKIVLIVAIVILILTLSVIGYMMYTTARNTTFPPLTGTQRCPDKWTFADNKCKNKIGSTSSGLNLGTFITDIKCVNRGTTTCTNDYMPGWTATSKDCSGGWVQGNITNGLDVSSCYMLASSALGGNTIKYGSTVNNNNDITGNIYDISYNLKPSLSDNIQWAKTYGLSWDGYL